MHQIYIALLKRALLFTKIYKYMKRRRFLKSFKTKTKNATQIQETSEKHDNYMRDITLKFEIKTTNVR